LDDATRAQLEHGQSVTELMKQKQYSPMSIADMGLSLYAANEGYLKDVDLNKVLDFEAAMIAFFNSEYADLMNDINATGNYSDEIAAQFKAGIEKFKSTQAW
ncbi:MAG: F0F1 ATP synthase subunit alpha, partial [Neptuniibacter sp.]|nr:F0F1 ATP synthase subunit alpha [Neptuniibacter sp.]